MGLRQLACWECGFEFHWGYRSLSCVSVVCLQEEVPATGLSLLQRSPAECGEAERDLETSSIRRSRPIRAAGQ